MGRPAAAALAIGLAAALLGAGCGKSKEHELFDQRKATCDGLVSGQLTVRQANEQFSATPVSAVCPSQQLQPLSGDICPYQNPPQGMSVCVVTWEWYANDDSLCTAFGCWYGCEARTVGQPGADFNPDLVCGTRWFKGQP